MLVPNSRLLGFPVLSLQVGGRVAFVTDVVVDPENLKVIAFIVDGPTIDCVEVGNILMVDDIREFDANGIIVDSTERFVLRGDIVNLDKILELEFDLIGLRVLTKDKKRLGKVADYVVDSKTLSVYQLIVNRTFVASLLDPTTTINRSQILELDDFNVVIEHDMNRVKIENPEDAFIPDFENPFRQSNYSTSQADDDYSSESDDSASSES